MAEAMLDFLDNRENQTVEQAALGIADWLRSAAIESEKGLTWAYKYCHGENETAPYNEAIRFPQGKGGRPYNVLRPLLAAALRRGDSAYVDVCLRHLDISASSGSPGMDQSANKCIEMGAWFDCHLWNARWKDGGLHLAPAALPKNREVCASIATRAGELTFTAEHSQDSLTVRLAESLTFPLHIRFGTAEKILAPGETQIQLPMRQEQS